MPVKAENDWLFLLQQAMLCCDLTRIVCRPATQTLLICGNRPGGFIHLNRYIRQWGRGWPLDNSSTFGGIKNGPMAGTLQHLTTGIIANRTAGVCAGGVVCDKLTVIEVYQYTRVAVGGEGEVDRAITRH